MNRINRLFQTRSNNILSVFFTAGYPTLHSTAGMIKALEQAGADMIEIGIPFSDPMADGPVIQKSSDAALKQGMSLKILFSQLKDIRREVSIPLLLMGYLNPVMQYGAGNFCRSCAETGIDGVILPDLPLEVYQEEYQSFFEDSDLHNICLVTPQTSPERIRMIDEVSDAFIYMVSSSSTTGSKDSFAPEQIAYFDRINRLNLKNPRLIGFGISNHENFVQACQYAHGAIIGSAFVAMLGETSDPEDGIHKFVGNIRGRC
jgi:tryptophan synthase alpha chain